MPFIGTIINTIAVVVGGFLGLLLKKGMSQKMQSSLMYALGLGCAFIGLSGVLREMLVLTPDTLATGIMELKHPMLLVISLVVGCAVGEIIDIDGKLKYAADLLRKRLNKENTSSQFVEGFVSCTLVIVVGAMSVVGGLEDGMGHPGTLLIKSVLDFITVLMLASTMGVGSIFSAIPLFLYQGTFALIGLLAGNIMPTSMISDISLVGNVLIFAIALNFIFHNVDGFKISVGNLLPALLIPVLFEAFCLLFNF